MELVGLKSPDIWIHLIAYYSAMQQFLNYIKTRDLGRPEVRKKALQHIEIMQPRGERILLVLRSILSDNNMEEPVETAALEEDDTTNSKM